MDHLVRDCSGGAFVDACAAVDTFACIDFCDIVNGYCVLWACVRASAASNTFSCIYFGHLDYLNHENMMSIFKGIPVAKPLSEAAND